MGTMKVYPGTPAGESLSPARPHLGWPAGGDASPWAPALPCAFFLRCCPVLCGAGASQSCSTGLPGNQRNFWVISSTVGTDRRGAFLPRVQRGSQIAWKILRSMMGCDRWRRSVGCKTWGSRKEARPAGMENSSAPSLPRHPGDPNEVLGRSSRPHSISSSWRWKHRAILGEAIWGSGCTGGFPQIMHPPLPLHLSSAPPLASPNLPTSWLSSQIWARSCGQL